MKPSLLLFLLFIGLGLSAQNCSNVSLDFPYGNADTLKVCQGQIEIDLEQYASIPGGDFSGPGIVNQAFRLDSVSVGTFEVMYVLGNDTCIKHIEVSPLSFEFPPLTSGNTIGFLEDAICTSDPAVDFSEYVFPSGGTFSGPGMVDSLFNPALAPPDSFLTISYAVDTLQCNKIGQINLRAGPIGYIAEILFPTSTAICGNETTNDIPLMANLPAGVNPAFDVFYFDNVLLLKDTIDASALTVGPHVLAYAYQENGCNFVDTLRFDVVAQPTFVLNNELDFGATSFCKNSGLLSLPKTMNGIETYSSNDLTITPNGELDSDNSPAGQYELFYSITDSTGTCGLMDTFVIDLLESVELEYELIPSNCEDIADSLVYTGVVALQGLEPLVSLSDYRVLSNKADTLILIDWDYPGEYDIDISVASLECISSGESIEIFVAPRLDDTCAVSIYLPNAFTPNTDNKNDVFFVQGRNIEKASLFVYDRWGALVFESTEMIIGWDGNSPNGTPLETGVYFYYAEVTYRNGKTVLSEGDVTLIR